MLESPFTEKCCTRALVMGGGCSEPGLEPQICSQSLLEWVQLPQHPSPLCNRCRSLWQAVAVWLASVILLMHEAGKIRSHVTHPCSQHASQF